ncbi:MAG TPA: S41 family peptidase [Steroidobacteraceae bacterium]|nr:S41 family peptidase [Steroidobacteraceae bacterium]
MKRLLIGMALGLVIASGVAAFLHRDGTALPVVTRGGNVAPPDKKLTAGENQRLAEVMERVQREYVDEVRDPQLIDSALRGLVGGLDPYSSYLDAEEYADLRVSTAGTYAGIGIEVSTADHALRVVRPFRDSPAATAGIRSGDMIASIDGSPVGADLDAAMTRMRGPRGSTVKLSVVRTGSALPLEFTVERAQVDVHSVAMLPLDGGFVYARITMFSDTTAEDFATGIARLRRDRGAKPRGVIIDLRNNPGGVLESAVEVADQMLESGVIVSAAGRTPAARFSMSATPGEILPGVPVILLVNGTTASAAEILAGALQDHHRATLLGRRTFGKGSVQTVMPISDGRAIKLTTSRYFTPSGRSIQGRGIDPDYVFDSVDVLPLDLDDARVRETLGDRDVGVHAALEVLKGRKPRTPGLTASTVAPIVK